MDADNTLDNPDRITPKAGTAQCEAGKKGAVLSDNLPAMTFRIYKVRKQ